MVTLKIGDLLINEESGLVFEIQSLAWNGATLVGGDGVPSLVDFYDLEMSYYSANI